MRCEEAARKGAGTDLHNGAQIPHWFLFNTSSSLRGERDGRRQTERGTARQARKKQQLVMKQTAEDGT